MTFPAPKPDVASQMRVLGAGDVNGDGYGDLLVGGDSVAELFLGGPTGVSTTPAEIRLARRAALEPVADDHRRAGIRILRRRNVKTAPRPARRRR